MSAETDTREARTSVRKAPTLRGRPFAVDLSPPRVPKAKKSLDGPIADTASCSGIGGALGANAGFSGGLGASSAGTSAGASSGASSAVDVIARTYDDSSHPWPAKLRQTQDLRLHRGEVVQVGSTLYAIVAYDGRNEGYLCWTRDVREKSFDTSNLAFIDRTKAQTSMKDFARAREVPPLPALDHTGRVAGTCERFSRKATPTNELAEKESRLVEVPQQPQVAKGPQNDSRPQVPRSPSFGDDRTGGSASVDAKLKACASSSKRVANPATPSSAPVGSSCASTACSTTGCNSRATAKSTYTPASWPSSKDSVRVDLAIAETPIKQCALCVLVWAVLRPVRGLASAVCRQIWCKKSQAASAPPNAQDNNEWLLGSDGFWHQMDKRWGPYVLEENQEEGKGSELAGPPQDSKRVRSRRNSFPGAVSSQSNYRSMATPPRLRSCDSSARSSPSRGGRLRHRDSFEDLAITIPILKPPGWEEVQPLVQQMPVTFDERGVKETMTVRHARWGAFVDRQRAKLQQEIDDLRALQQPGPQESPKPWPGFGNAESDEELIGDVQMVGRSPRSRRETVSDDEVRELEDMVRRIEDWKDLSQYQGKSISMGAARRGNEMRIHVVAFAEREDNSGVDFMRLSYKKSVELHDRTDLSQEQGLIGRVGGALRWLMPFLAPPPGADEERWLRLLQRPDVAKFTIALAFRDALEDDGVRLQFKESRLDHRPETSHGRAPTYRG